MIFLINIYQSIIKILLLSIVVFISGCEIAFDYSPYNAQTKNRKLTNINLEKIIEINADTCHLFKFAVITDNHFHYDRLKSVVNHINKNSGILFVLHAGDMTDGGLLKEYEFFYDNIKKINVPYFTVIGNHDYRSNGKDIYRQMFGELNYSFAYNNCKFIMFDDVFWESNRIPDFNWLETELLDNGLYKQVFVIAHIPPFSDQFDSYSENIYKTLLEENNVRLSIHGHNHSYYYDEVYNDGVKYLIVNDILDYSYCIVTVYSDTTFNIEKIDI